MTRRLIPAAVLAGALVLPSGAAAHGPPAITGGPSGPTASKAAKFSYAYEEPAPGQVFECQLDGGAWVECGEIGNSPLGGEGEIEYEDLAEGAHQFRVRRVSALPMDPLADDTPSAPREWAVDTLGPKVTLTSAPGSEAVTWTADEDGTFACSLDGAAFAACTSGVAVTGLATGDHAVRVRGTDALGNEGEVVEQTWTIAPPPPPPPPPAPVQAAGPAAPSGPAGLPAGTVPTLTVGKPLKLARKQRCRTVRKRGRTVRRCTAVRRRT